MGQAQILNEELQKYERAVVIGDFNTYPKEATKAEKGDVKLMSALFQTLPTMMFIITKKPYQITVLLE